MATERRERRANRRVSVNRIAIIKARYGRDGNSVLERRRRVPYEMKFMKLEISIANVAYFFHRRKLVEGSLAPNPR